MSAMAAELDVNRVTLYRWVGSREALLVEIVWALAERTLADVEAATGGRGAERVVAVVTRFTEVVIANPGMQRWLAEEGELAMRLLTRSDRGFQPRLIGYVEGLLERERVELEAGRREVAYVIVHESGGDRRDRLPGRPRDQAPRRARRRGARDVPQPRAAQAPEGHQGAAGEGRRARLQRDAAGAEGLRRALPHRRLR